MEQVTLNIVKVPTPCREALEKIMLYIRLQYFSDKMGKNMNIVCRVKNGKPYNGKDYTFGEEDIQKANAALDGICDLLFKTHIPTKSEVNNEDGVVAGRIKSLKEFLVLTKFTTDFVHKERTWISRRLSDTPIYSNNGKQYTGYDNFEDSDIADINNGLQGLALYLSKIKIVSDKPTE